MTPTLRSISADPAQFAIGSSPEPTPSSQIVDGYALETTSRGSGSGASIMVLNDELADDSITPAPESNYGSPQDFSPPHSRFEIPTDG